MTSFDITLNSKNDVFFPNAEVNGSLQLFTTQSNNITQITVWIVGRAGKYNPMSPTEKNILLFDAHSTNHEYMCQIVVLWQQNNASYQPLLDGLYKFPFKFVIPSNVPPSIIGEIKYYAKAIVEFGKTRVARYHGFSVSPIIDLNLDPKLKLPVSITETQIHQRTFTRARNSLKVTLSLPKTGYVCGETIPFQIDISNKTSTRIKTIEYGICLKYSYTVKRNVEESFTYILNTVKPTSKSSIYNFLIPPLPPSFSDRPFLGILYYVYVKFHTDAFLKAGPWAIIPITIGNIPVLKRTRYNPSKILRTADFVEEAETFRMAKTYIKIDDAEYRPKYAYYSYLSSTI